jgi:integrase/recombinase XerD
MAQAKSLTPAELEHLLEFVSQAHLRHAQQADLGIWLPRRHACGRNLKSHHCRCHEPRWTCQNRSSTLSADQTKGRHPRTVFLPQRLQTELQEYLDIRKPTNPAHPLFVTAGRRAFSANVLTQHLYWLYRAAGISGASSHSGRRTFITNLASKGISVRVLASLAGHRSIAVTQKYIDVNDDMKRNAVELA